MVEAKKLENVLPAISVAEPRLDARKTCPVCSGETRTLRVIKATYLLFECATCDLWYEAISRENTAEIYSPEYYAAGPEAASGYADYANDMKSNRLTFVDRLNRAAAKIPAKGRLLDYGCALGESLVVARELDWGEAEGVEISNYCIESCKERGLKVVSKQRFIKEAPLRLFDLVLMQDVIEHTSDPLDDLALIHRSLKPGGILFISTPNISGRWRKILGSFWYHFKPGEHLVYYSPKSLRLALAEAGFVDIEVARSFSVMGLGPIFRRLGRYSALFSFIAKVLEMLRLGDVGIKIPIGNLDAWARK